MNRVVFGFVAILFLLFASSITGLIQVVKADSGAITINADGSITPSTANVTTIDNVTYTFTGNNYLPIVVNRSNIMINGRGYTVQGTGASLSIGMYLESPISNVTIENVEITAFYYGVYLNGSSECTVSGNNVTANSYGGVELDSSSNNSMSGNNITADGVVGIWLRNSPNNSISESNITANQEGVDVVASSSYCNVSGNTFQNDGLIVENAFHNVVEDNEVNGKPLYYLESVWVPTTVPSDVGQVVLENCRNIVINNLTTSNATMGAELYQTDNTQITNSNITNDRDDGIFLSSSFNDSISENNVANNNFGVELDSSSNDSIAGNNITANRNAGIWLTSSNNSIIGNYIANNKCGIEFRSSEHNEIYHNDFVNNTSQVSSDGSPNVWDDGYPSGGNYWSDYNGTDTYSGPYQNVTGSDGIGDTPYVIDANNTDRYPLMSQYVIPEFPTFFILPLLITGTLLAVLVTKREEWKRSKKRVHSKRQ